MNRLTKLALLVLAVALEPAQVFAQHPRPLVVDDLFRTEAVGAIEWNTLATLAAVEIVVPGNHLDARQLRTRVHVFDVATQQLRGVAETDLGRATRQPKWSPDGRTLAMLLAAPGAAVHPALWAPTEGLRVLESIDVRLGLGGSPIHWLDSQRVLFTAWPAGAPKSGSLYFRRERGARAAELWRRRREGSEASATMLDTADASDVVPRVEPTVLIRYDLRDRSSRVLFSDRVHVPVLSPDGRRIAYFTPDPGLPTEPVDSFLEHEELYSSVNWGTALKVVDLATGQDIAKPVSLRDPDYDSVRWSSNGQKLVALGSGHDGATAARVVMLQGSTLGHSLTGESSTASAAVWVADRLALLVRGPEDRADWRLLTESGERDLTATIPGQPGALVPIGADSVFIESGGDVWRVDISEADPTPHLLTGNLGEIRRLRQLGDDRRFYALVDGRPSFLELLDAALVAHPIPSPSTTATLRSVSPDSRTALFVDESGTGVQLWQVTLGRLSSRTDMTPVWSGNGWVSAIRLGTSRRLEYSSLTGRDLQAWLLLPAADAVGPVPLVVSVYPGTVYRSSVPRSLRPTTGDFLHPQLFAALGYAVLLPSMPEGGSPNGNPIDELRDGVLPALDAAIATGLVDPERVAVVGQSAGGYAVLGLIAQSDRFRAAVASASYSDLASLYGTFYGQFRYGDGGHPQHGQVFRIMQMERGFMRMGGPPWQEPERYRHNSPLTHVESIDTPLMLVHGDLDFVPIQQSEQMFTALYRLGREVRFIRYHGEWHTVSGQANVQHLWTQLDNWLKRHLAH